MKKSLTHKILKHLAVCGSRLMLNTLFAPYGQSLGQAIREMDEIMNHCSHDFTGHSKETISVTLSRMKKRKLVTLSGPKKKAIWRITQHGKNHFKILGDEETGLPAKDGRTRVIMFDIPEKRRVERDWLRAELLSCDFTPLQKSVFLGLRPLPAKLLKKLKNRNLMSHIHVVGLEN